MLIAHVHNEDWYTAGDATQEQIELQLSIIQMFITCPLQLVIDWVKQDQESREDLLPDVLKHVRLPLVDPYFLFDKVDNERLFTRTVDSRMLIDEAKKYFILKVNNFPCLFPYMYPK